MNKQIINWKKKLQRRARTIFHRGEAEPCNLCDTSHIEFEASRYKNIKPSAKLALRQNLLSGN